MDKPSLRVEYFAGSLLFACRTRFHEPPPQKNERKKEFSLSPFRYLQTDFATI